MRVITVLNLTNFFYLQVRESFDLAYDKRYRKVNLPEYDGDYEGATATFTGYGADLIHPISRNELTEKPAFGYPDQLLSLQTTIISNEDCQEEATVIVTDGTICAAPIDTTVSTFIVRYFWKRFTKEKFS